jgi:hypothetical protein
MIDYTSNGEHRLLQYTVAALRMQYHSLKRPSCSILHAPLALASRRCRYHFADRLDCLNQSAVTCDPGFIIEAVSGVVDLIA